MTPEQKAAKFVAEMWDCFIEGGTLDGGDFAMFFVNCGLAEEREPTAEEASTMADYEEGDTATFLTEDGRADIALAKGAP